MDIYINNEKTSFELENEKNSFDIINAIGDFVGKLEPKHFITNISINDKLYSLDDEKKLKDIKVEIIKNIKIETGDIFSITSLTISQIESFINIIKNVVSSGKQDQILDNIDDSLKWMEEGLKQILKIYNPNNDSIKNEINEFFENFDKFKVLMCNKKNNFNEKDQKEAILLIDLIKIKMKSIKKWLVFTYRLPDREFILNSLNEIILNIDELISKLQNVPIQFQTGEDGEAMNTIQLLTDIFEECIDLFVLFKENFVICMDQYTIKEVSFDDFFKGITSFLKELMEAIQHNDYIMVGDLLEYEFVPNFEEIKKILIKIKEEAFTRAN
jgi:hypothetical protein